jgi:hypothetical protein
MNTNKCSLCGYELFSPLRLECDHTFCYVCINKHNIKNTKYCPVCKQQSVKSILLPCKYCKKSSFDILSNSNPLWIYDGRNYGWWLYSFANNDEIEILYQHYINSNIDYIQDGISNLSFDNSNNKPKKDNKQDYKITIFDDEYVVDFENMKQTPSKYMDRWRNIKRVTDKEVFNKLYIKGIAGYSFI